MESSSERSSTHSQKRGVCVRAPKVVPDVRVQFYIPDCTHLKGHCGNSVLKCDSIIEVSNLFHSGIRLPEPAVNHSIPENRMGRLSSEEQALEDGILPRYIIGMIRMTCMFVMSVTSGSMLAFFVSIYCTSHSQEGVLRMAMFMIPMLGVCVWSAWRFLKVCKALGRGDYGGGGISKEKKKPGNEVGAEEQVDGAIGWVSHANHENP
ncbi:hypothetical protein BSKO_13195 [Bryopsis sp. KO-2023]|nr:hypothetical protein BSKO_13195 [Bryopsis sp. KO-2023]